MRIRCPHCHQLVELPDARAAEYQPTTRGLLWIRFLLGMAWMATIASGLTLLNGSPLSLGTFMPMYGATVFGALVTAGLALAWLTRWAKNAKARTGQYAIGSLFFLMTFAAIFFASVRWVVGCAEAHLRQALPWNAVAVIGFVCMLVVAFTFPAVLAITEPLLWFGVWLVRWPPARPVWRLFLRRVRCGK
jgi:hypothetical protein